MIETPPPEQRKKSKPKGSMTNTKTLKDVGNGVARVAQACDRCRAKKIRCRYDGGQDACSSCESIGIKCIVSDKLSRRAFPKGYTEILEERIRQLEAENTRLSDLVNLRDEQINRLQHGTMTHQNVASNNHGITTDRESDTSSSVTPDEKFSRHASPNPSQGQATHLVQAPQPPHHHHGDGCSCGCEDNTIHERPVSVTGLNDGDHGPLSLTSTLDLSDDDDETNSLLSTDDERISSSLGSILIQRNKLYSNKFNNNSLKPAPGAFAAATAIEKMEKNSNLIDKQQMLTALVAASIPRTTEETLFVPTMLAGICQNYGYDSKPSILAANAIGSLKYNTNEINSVQDTQTYDQIDERLLKLIMNNRNATYLNNQEKIFFLRNLQLPTSRIEIDHLITIYFKEWGSALPIINRNSFLKDYTILIQILETGEIHQDHELSNGDKNSPESIERFGAIMILILSLSYLSNKHIFFSETENNQSIVDKYVNDLKHYDYLIHEFIQPHCLITKVCSIQSLQILTLALQYSLAIGDVSTCFELRGRVITMAQQLRLHRCPAAVLGVSGGNVNLRNLQQGERRILFWSIYVLDVYSSLNLGVPRLLKDFEIECALPFAGKEVDDDDDENENILIVNNTKLTIVGKVSRYSLSIMLYSKVLSSILDLIYSSNQESSEYDAAQRKETQLEVWRRELPSELKFEMGMNGFTLKSENETANHWKLYSKQQLSLVFLYFHARILIYLPIISRYGNHLDVGLSEKQKLSRNNQLTGNNNNKSSIISSISMIQQSSLQILEILKIFFNPMDSSLLPIPLNIPREHSRLALLVAKGTLDYIKGGALYSNSKQLLLDTIPLLVRESKYQVPGGLTKNSAKLIEMAILSILGLPSKSSLLSRKKLSNIPVSKPAVIRKQPNFSSHSSLNQVVTFNADNDNSGSSQNLTAHATNSFHNNSDSGIQNYDYHDKAINDDNETKNRNQYNNSNVNSSFNNNSNTNNSNHHSGKNPAIFDILDDNEMDIDSILEFDPFKVNLSQNLLINEFAADGSLGLVPFLNDDDLLNLNND